jgi:cobalt-zinc-cadmium efflux system protein
LNEEELHLEAHLDCTENITLSQFNDLLEAIENVLFEKFGINHVNIQPEFQKEDSKNFIVQD